MSLRSPGESTTSLGTSLVLATSLFAAGCRAPIKPYSRHQAYEYQQNTAPAPVDHYPTTDERNPAPDWSNYPREIPGYPGAQTPETAQMKTSDITKRCTDIVQPPYANGFNQAMAECIAKVRKTLGQ
ncbi:MAG: hypothetical protein AAB373_04115 [Patescibacteria group bacterium]